MNKTLAERLFGEQAQTKYLWFAAIALLVFMLGGRELWTQEARWANITWQMLYSGDYLHPYLAGTEYYDKPLLSYWLIIASSKLTAGLTAWSLRIPSALAGILTVFCVYQLGSKLISRQVGLLTAWMLLTSFYFIFWARTSSADMLNLAGTTLAILWYVSKREQPNIINFTVFFLILTITSLFKGLIGAVVPLIIIFPDLIKDNRWKQYLRLSILPALLPAAVVYVLPFWASTHFGAHQNYNENGLYEVYKENILRYFQPFDHEGPIYTYFIFLPVYMLPWAFFFVPALFSLKKRWSQLSWNSQWLVWGTLLVFIFLSLSGSRRNYYALPMLPFAMLLTADWIAAGTKRYIWAGKVTAIFYVAFFINFCIAQPLYYQGGLSAFGRIVRAEATTMRPWSDWQIVMLGTHTKLTLYLNPVKPIQILEPPNHDRDYAVNYTTKDLLTFWPIILTKKPDTIFITREVYVDKLKPYFKGYKIITAPQTLGDWLLKIKDSDAPVAFIPAK